MNKKYPGPAIFFHWSLLQAFFLLGIQVAINTCLNNQLQSLLHHQSARHTWAGIHNVPPGIPRGGNLLTYIPNGHMPSVNGREPGSEMLH
jgi:hypothetical protein